VYAEQKLEIKDAYRQIGELNNDLGSLREKHRAVTSDYEALLKRDIALAAALSVDSSPNGTPKHVRSLKYEQMDCDTMVVVAPHKNSYSEQVRKTPAKKPAASREKFPPLPNPPAEAAAIPIRSRLRPVLQKIIKSNKLSSKNSKSRKKAREVIAGSRFEVTGGAESWENVRNSVGKNLSCPKVRVRSTKSGILLFPEDTATLEALRSTGNLTDRLPNLPRLIIYGVDRTYDGASLPTLIINQNDNLGLTDEEARSIIPKFKI